MPRPQAPIPCLTVVLLGLFLPTARADAPDSPRPKNRPADTRFQLGKYVKGTPAEIRQTLQGPVDEFTQKTADAKRRVAECETEIAAEREAALPRARATARYQQMVANVKQAEADLGEARRSGTVQERLDAGSRLNRCKAAIEKFEKEALAGDKELALDQARLAEERQSVARCEQSLKKSVAWRDEWVYAIECTFRLRAPLDVGDVGVLTTVKVLTPNGPAHEGVLVEYEAAEQKAMGAEVEGIQTIKVVMKKVRLLLAPETPGAAGAKPGDLLVLYRNYRIEGLITDADGPIYIAARHAAASDALMDEVIPLGSKSPLREHSR